MITSRERELLKWIEENPMISQQELADRVNITRSSVAVHISNLMKKGYIQGKGYLLRKAPYVVVIGGANVDISGRPYDSMTPEDSNPGHVSTMYGGVGRNQAYNLRLLDVDVKFISAFGEDINGDKLRQDCRALGIDIRDALTVANARTSTYISIIDENSKLQSGISDMDIYEHITPEALERRKKTIDQALVCAADTNIPQQSLEYLADSITLPLFVETISKAKVGRVANILNRVHTLKTDQTEAPYLLGYEIKDEKTIRQAVSQLLERGVQNVYMHLPMENCVVCASKKHYIKLAYHSQRVINKNGARDSFMAALIWSYINGFSFEESARAGVAAASLCVATDNVVNSKLNAEFLCNAMQTSS